MPRTRWPKKRVFRPGFLVGRGFKEDEIAVDPLVQSTPRMVRTLTNSMGHTFSEVPTGNTMIDVSRRHLAVLLIAAKRRQLTIAALIGLIVKTLAEDPVLLANVLDDEG